MNRSLFKDALVEIDHPSVKDRSSPGWDYETFNTLHGEIRDYAAEVIADAAKLEHLISEPQEREIDLAAAYLIILDQWRRAQNTVRALMPKESLPTSDGLGRE